MAGSLEMMFHDVREMEGDFSSPYALIENLGDAYEACEEAVDKIERLTAKLERQDQYIQHLLGECPPNCKDCGE